jgi:hypothetical protein
MRHAWAHKAHVHVVSKAAAQQDAELLASITTFKQQGAGLHKLQADTTSTRLHLAEAYLQLGKAGHVLKDVLSCSVFPDGAPLGTTSHDMQQVQNLLAATGEMQLHFHDSFGLGWQQKVMTALDAEIEASLEVQAILEQYEKAVREDAYYEAKLEDMSSRGKTPPGSSIFQRNECKRDIAGNNLKTLVVKLRTALTERQISRADLIQAHGSVFKDAAGGLASVFESAISSHLSGSRDNSVEKILDNENIYGDIDDGMVDNFRRGLFDFTSLASKQVKASAANFKFAVAHKRVTTAKGQLDDECAKALAIYHDVDENLRNLLNVLEHFSKHWLAGWEGVATIAEDLVALQSHTDAALPIFHIACIQDSALKSSQSFSDQVLRPLKIDLDDFSCLPEVALECERAARTHLHYEEKVNELILNKSSAISLAKHHERIARNQDKKAEAAHASNGATERLTEALRRYDEMRSQTCLKMASAVNDIQLTYYSDILAAINLGHSSNSTIPTGTTQ